MKVERTYPIFLSMIKKQPDVMTHFNEHFRSGESITEMIQQKKFARILSGLMKMYVDHYTIQESREKDQRLKQEVEQLERHKAILLSSKEGQKMHKERSKKSEGKTIGLKNRDAQEEQQLLDQSDIAVKDGLLQQMNSQRSDTQNYELVYNTEAKRMGDSDKYQSSTNISAKRTLPTYDILRIKKLAEDAESENKARKATKYYRPMNNGTSEEAVYNDQGYSSDERDGQETRYARTEKDDIRRPGRHTENDNQPRGREKIRFHEKSEPEIRQLSPLAGSKFDQKREEFKRKKSSNLDSESPSPEKKVYDFEREYENDTFEQKMSRYNYTNLRKSRLDVISNLFLES